MPDHERARRQLHEVTGQDRHGDLAVVYAVHHASVLRLAYLLTGDRHVAEDLAADVFVRLGARGCEDIDEPAAYLRRAVVNAANSRWRRLATQRTAVARWATREVTEVADHAPSVDADLARSDVLWRALAVLPARQRTVLVLRYYEDLSEAEIADALGVGRGTVKSSAARGLARLREGLAASGLAGAHGA